MRVQAFTTIEKSLNAYLDTKKLAFPRFFFLSNDELLEILSETKDPVNVQPFVKKCFEAVESLNFERDLRITGCVSAEGEALPYDAAIDPTGEANGVEQWLLQVRLVPMFPLCVRPRFHVGFAESVAMPVTGLAYGCVTPRRVAAG